MTQEPLDTQTPSDTPKKSAVRDFLRGKKAVSPAATILVAVIYALLLLSRFIDSTFLSRESQYLWVFCAA